MLPSGEIDLKYTHINNKFIYKIHCIIYVTVLGQNKVGTCKEISEKYFSQILYDM